MFRHHALVIACTLSSSACDGPDGWSDLRSALTAPDGRGEVVVRDLVGKRDGEVAEVLAEASRSDLVGRVRDIDRARALDGRDALVAATYTIGDGLVEARTCGALTGAAERDRRFVVDAAWSAAEHARLGRITSRLAGWMATCGDDGLRPVIVAPGRGMPALVAWMPDRATLVVHPAALDALDARDMTEPLVATTVAALIDDGPDCAADLDAWCARCTTGAEPDCEPLFGASASFESCDTIDSLASASTGGAARPWRALYCAWRDLMTDPRARWWVFELDFNRGGTMPCWDRATRVVDGATLLAAFGGWDNACDAELARARQIIVSSLPFGSTGTGQMPRPDPGQTISECGDHLRDVTCRACTPDPRALCGSFFPGSTTPQDCYDFARAEAHGGAYAAACLYGAAFSFVDRSCFNVYDRCWERFAGGTDGLASFEALIASAPGFFDERTAERCIAQAERCFAGDPLHDFDPAKPFPGTPSEPPRSAEEDSKCPL